MGFAVLKFVHDKIFIGLAVTFSCLMSSCIRATDNQANTPVLLFV